MSHGGGAYVQWGWRIRPMGVAYTSKGAKVAYKSKGPEILLYKISPSFGHVYTSLKKVSFFSFFFKEVTPFSICDFTIFDIPGNKNN